MLQHWPPWLPAATPSFRSPILLRLMDLLVEETHVIDAGVALGTVLAFQVVYCSRKFRFARDALSRSQSWILIPFSSVLGLFGGIFLGLCLVFRANGRQAPAYAMLVSCKGTSIFSIWGFEVIDLALFLGVYADMPSFSTSCTRRRVYFFSPMPPFPTGEPPFSG